MRSLQTGVIALCVVLYVALVALTWPDLVFALALEDSPLAWFQTALLVACATAAALCASLDRGRRAAAWAAVALLLLGAALDDRFMGHERAQAWLVAWTGIAAGAIAAAIAAFYLVLGALAVAWLRARMQRPAWRWCLAALAVGTVALGLDAAFDTAAPQVIEETLEYVAESLMLVGLLSEARTRASRTH